MRDDFNVSDLLAGRVLYNNPFMAIFGLLGALIAIGAGGGGGSDDAGGSASNAGPTGGGGSGGGPGASGGSGGGAGPGTGSAAPSALVVPDPVEAGDAPAAAATTPAAPAPVLPGSTASATASSAPDLPDSAYALGWGGLNGEEQMIVEMVNRARLDPQGEAALQNEAIAPGGSTTPQEALAVVPTLSTAARDHSRDMDGRDFFAHTNPDGDRPWDRAQDAGHENGFVGENIGWIGSTGGVGNAQGRAEAHQNNLWESDGHQVNMLAPSWSEIGLGYDYGDYVYEGTNYTGSTFATQKFGDTGQTYLTGVVIDDGDGDAFYDIGEGQGGVRITAWNADGVFATATWSSGGYTLALPPGTYRVAFEGGDLEGVFETDVTIGSENVKLDVIEDRDASAVAQTASATPDPAASVLVLAELPIEGPPDPIGAAEPDPVAAAAYLLADSPLPPEDWNDAPGLGDAEQHDEILEDA